VTKDVVKVDPIKRVFSLKKQREIERRMEKGVSVRRIRSPQRRGIGLARGERSDV